MTHHTVQPWAIAPVFTKTFSEAVDSYLKSGGDGRYLEPILSRLKDHPLAAIVPYDVKRMAFEIYPSQSNATRNRQVLTPIRAVINHGHERGWCNRFYTKRLKEEAPVRRTPASPIWMHSFVRQCEKDKLPHLAAIVLFMSQTAARVSEAVNLKWREVDLASRRALLLKTKTNTNSLRHLTDDVVFRLRELRGSASENEHVFRYTNRHSVNERIKEVCRRAEISYKSSHLCGRHTFATTAIDMGTDIRTAMEAGDWKSPGIFLGIYVHPRQNSGRLVADRFNSLAMDRTL